MRLFLLVLVIFSFFATNGMASDVNLVVIAVSGTETSVKVGQKIGASDQIVLGSQTSIKLLSGGGQVVALSGPYSGPASGSISGTSENSAVSRIAKFLSERRVGTIALGAIRSGPPRTREPTDPFMVVIGARGVQCARGSKIQLWRKASDDASILELSTTTGQVAKLQFSKGENAADLPRQFVIDSRQLNLTLNLDGVISAVDLRLIPDSVVGPVEIADWLITKKCERQAALFLSSLQ